MKKVSFLWLLCCIVITTTVAQTVTISGPSSVNAGAQETYIANFNYTPDPYSIISWSVLGGTIISQNTNPTNPPISVIVQWNSTPSAGTISIYEDLNNGYAEKPVDVGNYSLLQSIFGSIPNRTQIDCSPISVNTCSNLITNNNFTPNNPYSLYDPFTENHIPGWTSSHGTPQINIYPGLQAPSPATGYAFMATFGESVPTGEGIAQKIPHLVTGQEYRLTFYMRFCPWLGTNPATQIDNLYAVLLKCNDFNQFPTNTYNTPAIPSNSKIVYHGTSIANETWVLINETFTADDDYDMIWFFPDQNINSGVFATIAIASPVLTEWPLPAINPAGPLDYYIPLDFACPYDLTLTSSSSTGNQWYWNNQPIQGATNQALNLGWKYGQCIPIGGQYYTMTNGCQSNTVTLSLHNYGYGSFGEEPFNFGALYHPVNSPNFYCLNTNDKIKNFDLGPNSTYTWSFINMNNPNNPPNITLNTNTYNSASPTADVIIGGNPYSGTIVKGVANNNGIQKIIDYNIYQTPYIDPVYGNNFTICAGQTANINMVSGGTNTGLYNSWYYVKPGGSNFDWEEYTIGPSSNVSQFVNQSFYSQYIQATSPNWVILVPGGNELAQSIQMKFSAPSFISKKFYNNVANQGCAEENLNVVAPASLPNCLKMITTKSTIMESEGIPSTVIYPNPALYSITITSKNSISKIIITDQYGRPRKIIETKNNNSIYVNVATLQAGTYSCAVFTNKGLNQLKLLIQR